VGSGAGTSPQPGAVDLTGRTVGADAAAAPAVGASTPQLNLQLPQQAGARPGSGSRGVLNLLPPPPEQKSKLAKDIEKSGRADCRTAHADNGLLAVVPLIGDAVRDKGCRW
jgi:hypothetical protein